MKINLINLIIFYFLFVAVYAQPGIIDNGFNLSDDCTFGQGESFDSDVFASIIQPDDKVVLGGNFSNYNGTPRSKIARVNTDGSLDASFNPGTGFNFDVFSLILQPDGKMVAGGFFTFYNLSTAPRIVRLNPDGSIDPTFNTGSGFNNAVRALELQPDGKIIAAGNFTSYNGTTVNRIVRLNSDGTLDTSFDPAGGFNAQVLTLSLQSDGKIIAGGEFTSFSGNTANHIVRLMDNGSFDPAFNIGSGFSDDVYTTFIQPDGKILVGGYFSTYNGISINNAIRLNIDGSLDLTFDIGISGPSSIVRCFAVKPDLKILIGGDFNQYEGLISSGIICVNQDGTLDNSFSADTMQLGFNSICIRSDQKIVGSGSFYSLNYKTRNYILCLEPNGGLNWNFNPGIGFDKSAVAICIQPDDKIICGGYFNSYNGVPRSNITRINTDGTIDSSFDPGSGFETIGFFGSYVSSIEIQTDNKIIIGGFFHTYQGIPRNCIARLNPDGSLDTSFDPGTGFLNAVTSVEVQADGKIIVTGFFSSYNGSSANKIIRLNSDGSIDPTFNSGSGFNLNVSKSCIQPDGKILVVGSFTNYNGNACNKIIRLNSDGSVDPSFITGTGFNGYVEGIDIMDDGKIITGGNFTSFNGIVRNRIALLNQDGSLDLSFNPLAGFNNTVWCIKALPNSDFLVGGDFTNYNSSIQNSIARLNIDGGIEPSFNSGLGFNDAVNSFSLQNDGQIVTCGNFTEYNGDCRTRISRIQNECITTYATITPVSCGSHVENGVTYTTSGSYSQTIPNTYWCDSIITINLTILPLPDTSEIVISVCDSFIQNGQAYYSSGVYNQIVPSTSGMCDSVIVIDLTILNSDSILNITSCGPYTENGITYSNSGIYTQIIPNSFGCDSTINIELTVVDIDSSIIKTETTITSVETGSMFQWLDCDCGYCEIAGANSASFTADSLGSFAVVIHKNACTDTSECVLIEPQDFYDLPGYQSLFAEVFAYPVSIIDS
ncbi:MAG: hypothetical protein JNJ99_14890, partial [Crocinitomicaceae bacterium]|nr:hypothetical protein [Crocinitomicaceae bacterium]